MFQTCLICCHTSLQFDVKSVGLAEDARLGCEPEQGYTEGFFIVDMQETQLGLPKLLREDVRDEFIKLVLPSALLAVRIL